MQITTSILLQAVLLGLAFAVTVLRCWVRLFLEHRNLTNPDYLVVALHLQIDHPLVEPDLTTDSIQYLKHVTFFDVGLYFPKASLVAFYWWLIPCGFRRLRYAVYISLGYVSCTFVATILTDTLIAPKISDNWSIDNQLNFIWNSYTALCVDWVLNWPTDILLFILPVFILNCLKLRKRQKIALCGVFSLGLITIIISLARFVVYTASSYNVDDASGNLWCTAEMAIATIVVSLSSLKPLLPRATPTTTSSRSNNGYIQAGSGGLVLRDGHNGTSRSHVQAKKLSDDEVELIIQETTAHGSRSGPSPTRTMAGNGTSTATRQEVKDGVMVTTRVTCYEGYTLTGDSTLGDY